MKLKRLLELDADSIPRMVPGTDTIYELQIVAAPGIHGITVASSMLNYIGISDALIYKYQRRPYLTSRCIERIYQHAMENSTGSLANKPT